MSVELKVGQVWRDRSGRKIAIVKNTTGRNKDSHPFMSFGSPWTYRSDGGFAFFSGMTHERDLIELVQDESGWRPWKATANRQCPVGGNPIVRYRMDDGCELECRANGLPWGALEGKHDIVAYKIIQEAPKASEPPDDDGWIPYSGGGCPVAAGTQLEARFAGGNTHSGIAGDYYWGSADAGTLVAYRIVKEAQKATEPAVQGRTPRRHSHYFKDISQINEIDVYRVCELFGVDDPSGATQHAVKKLLCAGQRGAKDRAKDYQEAIDTLTRRVEMWAESQQ